MILLIIAMKLSIHHLTCMKWPFSFWIKIYILKIIWEYLWTYKHKCQTIYFKLIHCRHWCEVIWLSYAIIFCYIRKKTYCMKNLAPFFLSPRFFLQWWSIKPHMDSMAVSLPVIHLFADESMLRFCEVQSWFHGYSPRHVIISTITQFRVLDVFYLVISKQTYGIECYEALKNMILFSFSVM